MTNITRAAKLVESFKQMAVEQHVGKMVKFDLQDFISRTLYKLRLNQKNPLISVDFVPSKEKVEILNYPGYLGDILTNLHSNALLHAFDEVNSGKIEIQVIKNEYNCQILFSDTGKGMDDSELKHIFDPFFTTKRNQGGTGIGLSVVHNLIKHSMSGDIICNSVLN